MQSDLMRAKANFFIDELLKHFEKRVSEFCISNVDEDESHAAFRVDFKAYDYFWVFANYDRGVFGCSIRQGEALFIPLNSSYQWWEKTDFTHYFEELQSELELRIPDKFLRARGWL